MTYWKYIEQKVRLGCLQLLTLGGHLGTKFITLKAKVQ